ncbi:hypothetical protein TEA_027881 [Camellia sinensis var. sinensis]|uniref:Mitochondrial adenine nucleotide transporter ADNT1 n=1 Tax=Camellia sinensis var. sinensis TaxID=542762 RepID=A0A4S4D9H2_CAMSN|nr:hypothetical protein TEA_027881 [Camellia sinensis var. sinensis]
MASEDVVAKTSETAVSTIVNLAEEAKIAREGVKAPSHALLSICKSLVAGGVAGGVSVLTLLFPNFCRFQFHRNVVEHVFRSLLVLLIESSRSAVAPLERLKILLQVQNPHSIKYNGTVQGLKYIWRTEGFRGLFKGNGTNCARIVPNSAVKFFSYEEASKGILWFYRQQTGKEDAELTPPLRLGAGACAGIIAMSATYPMDMVRGRLTVQTEMSPRQYRGIFHALSTVFREEGPRALYRGWLPSVIGVVNWLIKSRPFGLVENTELSVTTKLACGAAAGTVGQTVAYPLDVIRRRMQMVGWKDAASVVTGDGKSKAPLEYSGMVDAFRKTVRHEGFGALYKGLIPNLVKGCYFSLSSHGEDAELNPPLRLGPRACAGIIAMSATYPMDMVRVVVVLDLSSDELSDRPFGLVENTELSVTTKLACGAAAGTVGQTVAYPLDVIRRRMQMVGWKDAASVVTGDGKSKAPLEYSGMVDAFRKTVRHEGFGALYKGLVPNSVKVVPSIAIAFVTYEVVKDILGVEMRISD